MGLSFLKSGARLADLTRQRLSEHARLRREELLEEAREVALVGDERREPLRDLTVLRVEELCEDGRDRALLLLDVGAEVAVDLGGDRAADVLELRLLRLRVGVRDRVETDAPGIDAELIALVLGEVSEELDGVGARVAHVGGDEVGRREDRHGEGRGVVVRHEPLAFHDACQPHPSRCGSHRPGIARG